MTKLGEALNFLTKNHKLDPITDNERVKSQGCKLRSGEESLFVTVMCCEIQRRLERQGIELPINELFYCPSRRTEWKLGFDLSIGYGRSPWRIRTMHKLLTGRLCDNRWTWCCTNEDALHMALLMGADQVHKYLEPFLVIHVCYCVHDYRRMGAMAPKSEFRIPSFDSPLRTIIVDLAALRDVVGKHEAVEWPDFIKAVNKCDDKKTAVQALAKFKIERLSVAREECPDLTELAQTFTLVLDKYCPCLYYPSEIEVNSPRQLFLTFDEFMKRV